MRTPKDTFASRPLPPDRRTTTKGVFARAVGSFVPKLAGKAFEKYGFHSAEIMTAWPRVAGAEIAGFTQPERIKWPRGTADADGTGASGGATLVLRVDPARALDVEYRSAEIIDRINRYFGYRAVATLRLVQAPLLTKTTEAPPLSERTTKSDPAPIPAAADGELKSALETLWASVTARAPRR
ncbi:MAG: DciA family protein [Hyphomicrobium sp.]